MAQGSSLNQDWSLGSLLLNIRENVGKVIGTNRDLPNMFIGLAVTEVRAVFDLNLDVSVKN